MDKKVGGNQYSKEFPRNNGGGSSKDQETENIRE
jgi:hypothetical protein